MSGVHQVLLAIVLAAAPPEEPSAPPLTLPELKAIARQAHPTLESADAALEVAAGSLRQAGTFPNPELALGAGSGRPRDGGESRTETLFEIRQPIETAGLRRWRNRAAELGLRAAELDRLQAHNAVDSAVARLVYRVLLEERRADVARRSADATGRLHDLLQRRVELGESSPLEAVKAESEWFQRRRDLLDAEAALESARRALDLFCGGELGPDYEIAESLAAARAAELPDDLVDRLRARNPLLRRASLGIEEAHARTEVARKETFPGFDLFAGYEDELDRTAGSLGLGVVVPLWSRNRGSVEAAVAREQQASADHRALVLELETALAAAVADFRRAASASELHREGWTDAARAALDIATFSYANGEASLLEVLDAQRSYLQVVLAEAESHAELALAWAEIERLIGGPLAAEATP